MALASEPKVLLLDEPLAGMGPEESERMTALLKHLAREHALLLIEHDMDFVFAVADWMTVMAEGAVLAEGKPRRSAPTSPCRRPISEATRDAGARLQHRCSRAAVSTPTTARATCCAASRSASSLARRSA